MSRMQLCSVYIVILFVPVALCVKTTKTKPKSAKTLYPFLYFSDGEIPQMRRQAKTTHNIIATKIRNVVSEIKRSPKKYMPPKDWDKFASRWNEHYGNNLCALAMHCVLNEWDVEARRLAFQFMDTFSSIRNWRVKANLRDDVPVSHSLNGMATAYDFLYSHMSSKQRLRYMNKIVNATKELYYGAKKGWWYKSYIQNHVLTNWVALLTGALVASRQKIYSKEASIWKMKAHQMLGRNMYLLNYVIDGSMNEGVPYGTYTSRSVTQYVYFALRHFKTDFRRNEWLKQHFWFLYYTILPGFTETVGIADSNKNWFYGPESQLVFLDRFVMRNGYGNWLAQQIKSHRSKEGNNGQASSMINCMLHTEFIFYDATITPRAPPDYYSSHLHVFSDWGVAIYREGISTWKKLPENSTQLTADGGTFLSFKCSVLHGRAVNQMVISKPPVSWVKGWRSFNPGHEHLDQGSFVFAPNGVPFITEALYGPKYTWLNNAILFGPSFASPCSAPLEGQLGECLKWLDYRNLKPWRAQGDIITVSVHEGLVLTCGEMATWYRGSMGLASVYRCLVLLSPSILLVVDHVERKSDSKMNQMSAFFHNVNQPFKLDECNEYVCAETIIGGRSHRVVTVNSHSLKSNVLIGTLDYSSEFQKRQTNFVNITTPLKDKYTRVAYLFMGPGNNLKLLHMSTVQDHGVFISIAIDNMKYTVAIVTKHGLPYARFNWLGFGGYGKVKLENVDTIDKHTEKTPVRMNKIVRFGLDSKNETLLNGQNTQGDSSSGNSVMLIFLPVTGVSCAMLFLYFQLTRKVSIRTFWKIILVCLILIWGVVSLVSFLKVCTSWYKCNWGQPKDVLMENAKRGFQRKRSEIPPFVVYTSLPWAGAEVLGDLFRSNRDFFQFDLVDQQFNQANMMMNVSKTQAFVSKEFLDPCALYQIRRPDSEALIIAQWFRQYMKHPKSLVPKLLKKAETSLPALHLKDPGWSLRFRWLRRVVGSRMKAVVVVRDPRGWVSTWLNELKVNPALLRRTRKGVDDLKEQRCGKEDEDFFVPELKVMQRILSSVEEPSQEVSGNKLLAHLWASHVNAVLRLVKGVPKGHIRVIRFEDLVLRPKKTTQRVYRFMSIPVPPAVENRMLQVTRTGRFNFGNSHEKVEPSMLSAWKNTLSVTQIREIENICSLVMSQLRYKPTYSIG